MKIKSLYSVTLAVAVLLLYGHTESSGVEPRPTDVVTRYQLEDYVQNQEETRVQMIEQAIKSTVLISGHGSVNDSIGTGFFISPSTLVTNRHVVDSRTIISIVTYDHTFCKAMSVTTDVNWDLAIIKTDCKQPYITADFKPRIGQDVYAIGNPKGLQFSVTRGIVSAIQSQYIQLDATVNNGNSGGPLINSKGEVIGIVTAKGLEEKSWMGFAIPISAARFSIENALEQEVPDHGNVHTG